MYILSTFGNTSKFLSTPKKKNMEWNKDIQKYKDQEAPLDPKRYLKLLIDIPLD